MEEKKNIGQLFDRIALTYDRFNHLLSLNIDKKWRRRAVKGLSPSEDVLDVAVGTADLSIELMRQGKAARIIGIDLSSEMMKIGEKKVAANELQDRISFKLENAQQMSFADGSFDAVTCAYGVRNFSELDKGLQEFYRVLKAGGQLMILEFSYPSSKFVRFFYDFFFTQLMPLVGRAISKDKSAYIYFKDSVKSFIWGEEMLSHIKAAGFEDCRYRTMTLGISTVYYARKK